jgi:tRNA dimethylallyltransferase
LTGAGSQSTPLIALVGPTASGKTDLALKLHDHLPLEAIGADSRQVYRLMDIGTAKPSREQQAALKHHLVDVVMPDEDFHLAEYLRLVQRAISEIRGRGQIPLLVGGTAQYVWAVLEGWTVPSVPPDLELRAELSETARRLGPGRLHSLLSEIDPEAARSIHPHNARRLIRALELFKHSGRPPSRQLTQRTPRTDAIVFGIALPRPGLYARIDARVDEMFRFGLIEEVERLLDLGYSPSLPSMSGIGYTQVAQLLSGKIARAEAMTGTKTATHRLARQQSTWFRASDQRIQWVAPGDIEPVVRAVSQWNLKLQQSSGASA